MKHLKIFCLFLLILSLMIIPSFAISISGDLLNAAFGSHANDVTINSSGQGSNNSSGSLIGSFQTGFTGDGGANYSVDAQKEEFNAMISYLESQGIDYTVEVMSITGVDITCNNGSGVTAIELWNIYSQNNNKPGDNGGDDGGDDGGDNGGDDDPPECSDTYYSHICISQPADIGTPAEPNISMPFSSGNITPNSENDPFMRGSSFSINGISQHVERTGSNPTMHEETIQCSGSDYITCTLGIHDYTFPQCSVSYSYIDYGEPEYVDFYNAVNISFKGFRVDEGRENYYTMGSTTNNSNTGSRPALESIGYSAGYIITELIDTELEEVSTGLFKGSVTVACSCGCGSNVFPIYFKITDPEEPILEPYKLNLKAVTILKDGMDVNVGRVAINDGTFGESTSKEFEIDMQPNIKAKLKDGYQDNYEFKGWYEPNESYYKGNLDWYINANFIDANANISINMPGYDYTLIALFGPKKVITYNVRVWTDGNGTVEIGDEKGQKIDVTVKAGETITIEAIPYKDDKYEFKLKNWQEIENGEYSIIGVGNNTLSRTINKDYDIYVTFECDTGYTLTVEVNEGKYDDSILKGYTIPEGTINAVPGQKYDFGVYPNQEEGYYFYSWSAKYVENDGTTTVPDSRFGQFDSIVMPEADVILSANITHGDFSTRQIVVKSNGGGYVGIDGGEFSETDSVTIGGDVTVTIKAVPKEEFLFKYWKDESENIIDSSVCVYENGIYTYEVRENVDKEYVAYFEYIGEGFRLNVESTDGGKAIGSIDNAKPGELYRIKATPYNNYNFDYWKDDTENYLGSDEEKWIEMPERDYTVTAYFEKNSGGKEDDDEGGSSGNSEEYELTIKHDGEGNTDPAPGTRTYPKGENVNLEAWPKTGYEFDGWYENNKLLSKNSSYLIKMYSDRKLIARFIRSDEKNISAFKVISIRDLSWKDYFTSVNTELNNHLTISNNANQNTVLVDEAQLIGNRSDRRVKFGYAVECELETWDIECGTVGSTGEISKSEMTSNTTQLYVEVSIPGISSSLGEYGLISSKSSNSIDRFMISATKEYKTLTVDGISMERPVIKWRWVYYLPIDFEIEGIKVMDEDFDDDLVVNFDIQVKVNNNISYRYNRARKITEGGNWGGNVFTYRTDKTLLDDIDNDAIN